MTEPQFAFSRDFKATLDVRSNVTPKPVVSFRVTIRTGATEHMIQLTVMHFIEACRALFDGELPHGGLWLTRSDYPVSEYGESFVNIYSLNGVRARTAYGLNTIAINKCNEHTTAVELVKAVYESENPIAAALMLMGVGSTQRGEREATLQPDTPYPVPTIIERKQAQQKKAYDTRGLGAFDDDPDGFYDDVEKRTLQSW